MDIAVKISLAMVALAIPFWGYRTICFYRLDTRDKIIIRRLIAQHESFMLFGSRVFGFLVVLSGVIFALLYVFAYFKNERIRLQSFSETLPKPLYSGMNMIDSHIDSVLYDQMLPMMVLAAAFMLAFGYTVLMTALRDIRMINRLNRGLGKPKEKLPAR